MDHIVLVSEGYRYLEHDDVYNANMICLRLAKLIGDRYNTIMFSRELHPDINQLKYTIYDSLRDMNKDAVEFLWTLTLDHWIIERQMPGEYDDTENHSPMVLHYGIGEIDSELDRLERSINDILSSTGMDTPGSVIYNGKHNANVIAVRERIHIIQTIRQRIKTRCLNYISRMEAQIESQQMTSMFLQSVQNEVHNYFALKSDDVYGKLQKAVQLINSTNHEDQSLLLTEVRRTIHAVADYFYPPINGQVVCRDGKTHPMGPNEYLNRLHEFLYKLQPSSSKDLMLAESESLTAVANKLNHHASKGVTV